MGREIGRGRALLNAALVLIVLGLAGVGVVQVARRNWQWQETFRVEAGFPRVAGLEAGNRVRIQGMDAGVVDRIDPPATPGAPVRVVLRIDARLRSLVRADAAARIETQGVVGAKVVEIVPGLADAPPLADGATLVAEPPLEVADILKQASESLRRVDAVAAKADQGLGEVNAIAASIRQGEGSLGKLVRDDDAYRSLMSLSDRGGRTLDDLDENLEALKQTWPLSRYFDRRGFDDRETVLYQPGSERETRVLPADDLFEPGRAVLTAAGRKHLDGVGTWFNKLRRPKTAEIVIAAFTDDTTRDEMLARRLTQDQAEAVRRYLTATYKLDSAGWFRSRRVAAVGFGTEVPRTVAAADPPAAGPGRRVEVIVFTPQT